VKVISSGRGPATICSRAQRNRHGRDATCTAVRTRHLLPDHTNKPGRATLYYARAAKFYLGNVGGAGAICSNRPHIEMVQGACTPGGLDAGLGRDLIVDVDDAFLPGPGAAEWAFTEWNTSPIPFEIAPRVQASP